MICENNTDQQIAIDEYGAVLQVRQGNTWKLADQKEMSEHPEPALLLSPHSSTTVVFSIARYKLEKGEYRILVDYGFDENCVITYAEFECR